MRGNPASSHKQVTEVRRVVVEALLTCGGSHIPSFQAYLEKMDLDDDLSVDSLHMMETVVHLEGRFNISLPDEELGRRPACLRSLGAMSNLILEKLAAQSPLDATPAIRESYARAS